MPINAFSYRLHKRVEKKSNFRNGKNPNTAVKHNHFKERIRPIRIVLHAYPEDGFVKI